MTRPTNSWRWTEAQRQLLREMWPTNGTHEIARVFGTTRKTIRIQANKMGLPFHHPGRPKWTREQEDRLRELWPQMSCSLIAEKMGITHRAVFSKARRIGLPHRFPPLRRPADKSNDERWHTEEFKNRVREHRRQGLKIREIAALEGVNKNVIAGLIYRLVVSPTNEAVRWPTALKRREKEKLRRSATLPTELTVDLPPNAPHTCQYVYGNPLRFCTNKRAVVAGRVSMYCTEHGWTIKPTPRLHPDAFA